MHETFADRRARPSALPASVRRRHLIALLVFAGALLTLMFFLYHDPHSAYAGDGYQYVKFANHLDRFVEPPFGYRVLAPAIVSVLPFTTLVGFQVLTVTSLAVTSVLVVTHVLMLFPYSVLGLVLAGQHGSVRKPTIVVEPADAARSRRGVKRGVSRGSS